MVERESCRFAQLMAALCPERARFVETNFVSHPAATPPASHTHRLNEDSFLDEDQSGRNQKKRKKEKGQQSSGCASVSASL